MLALAAVSVVVLGGCSGTSEESDGPDPSPTSDVAAPLDDETALSESICTQQGQYTDITSVDAGDDAFVVFNKAYALVGDRVVSALYTVPATPPEQFEALLQLAASAADQLPEPVSERRGPECGELDTEAAAALRDEPTITRGSTDDQLTCTWGTSSASIALSGFEGRSTAVEELEMDTTSFGGTSIDGLGVAASVFDDVDGTSVQWVTAGGTSASVRTATGLRAEPDDLIALAKAAAGSYE